MTETKQERPAGRQPGAATALILAMLDRAIGAQRDGGESVQVAVTIDTATAKAIGVAGEGEISLRLWPCVTPDPGSWRNSTAVASGEGSRP